jgi:REP element-mobilizing transposase RayT
MSEYVNNSHNVTVLIHRLVFSAKYRRAVFDEHVDEVMKDICMEIEKRYQMKFVEICIDKDHVHFLVLSIPTYIVTRANLNGTSKCHRTQINKVCRKIPLRGLSSRRGGTGMQGLRHDKLGLPIPIILIPKTLYYLYLPLIPYH